MTWPVLLAIALMLGGVVGTSLYVYVRLDQRLRDATQQLSRAPERLTPLLMGLKGNDRTDELLKALQVIPEKTLQAVTGSASHKKGAIGELIGYINLKAEYDVLIPVGNITDFVCIRFDKEDQPGTIDFVDVKYGKKARLSPNQTKMRKLIEDKKIGFVKLSIDKVNVRHPD